MKRGTCWIHFAALVSVFLGCSPRCTQFDLLPQYGPASEVNRIIERIEAFSKTNSNSASDQKFPLPEGYGPTAVAALSEGRWIVAARMGGGKLFEVSSTNVLREIPYNAGMAGVVHRIQIVKKEPLTLVLDASGSSIGGGPSARSSFGIWIYADDLKSSREIENGGGASRVSPGGKRVAYGNLKETTYILKVSDLNQGSSVTVFKSCWKGSSANGPKYFWLDETNLVCFGESQSGSGDVSQKYSVIYNAAAGKLSKLDVSK